MWAVARLHYLDAGDLGADDQQLLTNPANLFRALAHSPGALRAILRFADWNWNRSRLDPRLRELASIQVGYSTRTLYEYAHHLEHGRAAGLSDADLSAVAVESAGGEGDVSVLERLVLRAAREVTLDLRLGDGTFRALHDHLSDELVVDLVVTIAFYNAIVRIIGALGIDLEPGEYELLERFPLPEGGKPH